MTELTDEELGIVYSLSSRVRNLIYDIIRKIITETYGEPLLLLIISDLRSRNIIREPQELVDYMVSNPKDFYEQLIKCLKNKETAKSFLKTVFDEVARRIGLEPIGGEIITLLDNNKYTEFKEKILEIAYKLKTEKQKPMF